MTDSVSKANEQVLSWALSCYSDVVLQAVRVAHDKYIEECRLPLEQFDIINPQTSGHRTLMGEVTSWLSNARPPLSSKFAEQVEKSRRHMGSSRITDCAFFVDANQEFADFHVAKSSSTTTTCLVDVAITGRVTFDGSSDSDNSTMAIGPFQATWMGKYASGVGWTTSTASPAGAATKEMVVGGKVLREKTEVNNHQSSRRGLQGGD